MEKDDKTRKARPKAGFSFSIEKTCYSTTTFSTLVLEPAVRRMK